MEDFPSFWNYLRTRNSEVIVLSIDNRINTLREYLHEVHQYNLPLYPDTTIKLQPVQKSDNRGNHFQLNFYKLEL
jgi:hypothetical protein